MRVVSVLISMLQVRSHTWINFSNSRLISNFTALYRVAFCRVFASVCESKLCLCVDTSCVVCYYQ